MSHAVSSSSSSTSTSFFGPFGFAQVSSGVSLFGELSLDSQNRVAEEFTPALASRQSLVPECPLLLGEQRKILLRLVQMELNRLRNPGREGVSPRSVEGVSPKIRTLLYAEELSSRIRSGRFSSSSSLSFEQREGVVADLRTFMEKSAKTSLFGRSLSLETLQSHANKTISSFTHVRGEGVLNRNLGSASASQSAEGSESSCFTSPFSPIRALETRSVSEEILFGEFPGSGDLDDEQKQSILSGLGRRRAEFGFSESPEKIAAALIGCVFAKVLPRSRDHS
jgi:hypothetical protein